MHNATRGVYGLIVIGLLLATGCKGSKPNAQTSTDGGGTAAVPSGLPRSDEPVHQLPIPPAVVTAAVNPTNLPEYDGPTGSVEGTVSIRGDAPPEVQGINFHNCPAAVATRATLFQRGSQLAGGSYALPGVIVAVSGFAVFVAEHRPTREVVLEDCSGMPRTIDMTYGQRLDVFNRTKLLFAPDLEQFATATVMVATPKGDSIKLYARRPGHFRMVDRLGAGFLSSDVYVLFHPLHASSDRDGRYRIDGIPVGKLKIGAHFVPTNQDVNQDVNVEAGQVSQVNFELTYEAKAKSTSAATP